MNLIEYIYKCQELVISIFLFREVIPEIIFIRDLAI